MLFNSRLVAEQQKYINLMLHNLPEYQQSQLIYKTKLEDKKTQLIILLLSTSKHDCLQVFLAMPIAYVAS